MAKRARIETPSSVTALPDDTVLVKSMIGTFGHPWTTTAWQTALISDDTSKSHIEDIIRIAEDKHKTAGQVASDLWDTFVLPRQLADRLRP